jgi:hypothetical protein
VAQLDDVVGGELQVHVAFARELHVQDHARLALAHLDHVLDQVDRVHLVAQQVVILRDVQPAGHRLPDGGVDRDSGGGAVIKIVQLEVFERRVLGLIRGGDDDAGRAGETRHFDGRTFRRLQRRRQVKVLVANRQPDDFGHALGAKARQRRDFEDRGERLHELFLRHRRRRLLALLCRRLNRRLRVLRKCHTRRKRKDEGEDGKRSAGHVTRDASTQLPGRATQLLLQKRFGPAGIVENPDAGPASSFIPSLIARRLSGDVCDGLVLGGDSRRAAAASALRIVDALLQELVEHLFELPRRLREAEMLLDARAHHLAELRPVRLVLDDLRDAVDVRGGVLAEDDAFAADQR